jgi:Ca-activated chloride channel family protein
MMTTRIRSFLILAICLSVSALAACQPAPRIQSEGDLTLQITQIDTSAFPLVDVYISVLGKDGEPQLINTSKLQLLENGQPINPQSVRGEGEVGQLTTLLLMDNSGSMNFASKLESAKAAAKGFLNQMRTGDQTGVITFNTEVEMVQEITQDRGALEAAIDNIRPSGDTAMFDALVEATRVLNPLPGRKAVIVLTDGMDNQSQATVENVLSGIGFGGLSISTVGFGDPPPEGEDVDVYEGIDETTLRYIAQNAGGIYGYADDETELASLYDRIRRSLQSEVVISYITPLALRDGVQRALTVELADNYSGVGGRSITSFNPGGLVPEVAQPASWGVFALILAALVILLCIPLLIQVIGSASARKKKKVRIKLKD